MTMILIVSERPEFRLASRRALLGREWKLLEARDGLAALQHFVEDRPVAVLLDVALEGFRALDLRDRMAREIGTASIPVWIASDQELVERATQMELMITSAPPSMPSASG